jgi:hypothetical protein
MFRETLSRLGQIMIKVTIAMCGADVAFAPELREDVAPEVREDAKSREKL